LCLSYSDHNFIGGCFSGHIFTWDAASNASSPKATEAHNGAVMALCKQANDAGFITGGNDGKIIFWDPNIDKKMLEFDLNICSIKNMNSTKIRAIAEDSSKDVVIGTRGGELIELRTDKGDNGFSLLVRGHYHKKVTGIANIPNKGEFITCGQDRLLIIYEIGTRRFKESIQMMYSMTCIDVTSDGK